LFSLHLFYGYALCNLAILATETNKCDFVFLYPTNSVKALKGFWPSNGQHKLYNNN